MVVKRPLPVGSRRAGGRHRRQAVATAKRCGWVGLCEQARDAARPRIRRAGCAAYSNRVRAVSALLLQGARRARWPTHFLRPSCPAAPAGPAGRWASTSWGGARWRHCKQPAQRTTSQHPRARVAAARQHRAVGRGVPCDCRSGGRTAPPERHMGTGAALKYSNRGIGVYMCAREGAYRPGRGSHARGTPAGMELRLHLGAVDLRQMHT